MARKRTISDALDLTQYDTDEDDDDYSDSPSTSTRSTRSRSRKKRSSTAVTSPSPSPPSTALMRMVAAGLAPRGRLFGGSGLISDEKLKGGREKLNLRSSDDKDAHKKEIKHKSEIKAVGDGILSFRADPSKPQKPQVVEFPKSRILYTTLIKRKARPRKKKSDDSAEEESSDSEGEVDPDALNLSKIIGEPERVQRLILSGQTIQHPWTLNAFGTKPDPTRHRSPRKKKPTKKDEEGETKVKKARKPAKPKRTYKNDGAKALILHDTPFDEKSTSTVHSFKNVVTFQANPAGKWNARFLYMMYSDATNRLRLRIAITTARPEYENWTSPENAIWVQDFPSIDNPASKAEHNPSHSDFSNEFFTFVGGGSGLLTNSANMSFIETARFFDFSASKDTRIVKSIAGTFKGKVALEKVGGLDSLAKAVKSFKPEFGGAWTIEYITPLSSPITRKFLNRLFAAAQGVTPVELEAQETQEAIRALEKFKPDKIKICYPTADNVDKTQQEKVGRHALRFDTKDDVDFDRLPAADIRGLYDNKKKRYSIMHDFDLKSERVNHTTMMVIFHSDPSNAAKKLPEPYEAFIYLGSHSPTPESWGSYAMKDNEMEVRLANSELGVLERVRASSWKKLVAKVNEIVPYDRTSLEPYKRNDFPCPTPEPRVVEKRGKKKKGEEDEDDD